jgi:YidC/Oxa1 family membrane protein insertase
MTANNGAILGPISKVLGWIMDKIYMVLSNLGISSIALSIVLLTVLIYLCLFSLLDLLNLIYIIF